MPLPMKKSKTKKQVLPVGESVEFEEPELTKAKTIAPETPHFDKDMSLEALLVKEPSKGMFSEIVESKM